MNKFAHAYCCMKSVMLYFSHSLWHIVAQTRVNFIYMLLVLNFYFTNKTMPNFAWMLKKNVLKTFTLCSVTCAKGIIANRLAQKLVIKCCWIWPLKLQHKFIVTNSMRPKYFYAITDDLIYKSNQSASKNSIHFYR